MNKLRAFGLSVGVSAILGLGVAAQCRVHLHYPQPLFRYSVTRHNLQVYSDRAIPAEASRVMERIEEKLEQSPLYDARFVHRAFLCHSRWRQYDLMVAHLLDRRGRGIRELLRDPPPEQDVERESMREGK